MNKLSERLKKARKIGNLTQGMLSKRTKISLRALQSYEQDASKISVDRTQKIASACGVNVTWLLTGEGEPFITRYEHPDAQKSEANESSLPFESKAIQHNSILDAEHLELIKQFKDKKLIKELNHALLRLEQIDPGSLREIRGYLRRMIEDVS